jgi:hypothetical protein
VYKTGRPQSLQALTNGRELVEEFASEIEVGQALEA